MYTYIYIERERCVYMYYIYIYICILPPSETPARAGRLLKQRR